ncbi:MAG TPA: hypothetical protein PKG60_17090 [Spirochaetota bacterium]|nr:hypothetical protein [Spirochaetota bacterium]
MNDIIITKIESSISECDSHLQKISRAFTGLNPVFPLTELTLKNLADETVTLLDQFLYRFIKLQDAMGTRLIPVIAGLIYGNNDPRPFIDNLNILEKNRAIDSAEKWQELRNLRNRLAHEYPENTGQTVEVLNLLMEEWTYLRDMYLSMKNYFKQRLSAGS